jgi:hypothetical protein
MQILSPRTFYKDDTEITTALLTHHTLVRLEVVQDYCFTASQPS